MRSERNRRAFIDMLENALLARGFVKGLTFEEFSSDRRTFYAVTRCLEIISEAARHLDDDARSRHPGLPWKQIMGAGNVYRHDYDNVAELFVWRTVTERLGEIVNIAKAETEST